MTDATKINFLTELRDLLKRYDASFEADCDELSDLHGVFGEVSGLTIGKNDRFNDRLTVVVNDSWGFDADCLTRVIEKYERTANAKDEDEDEDDKDADNV